MKTFFCIIFLFHSLFALDYADFDGYQGLLTKSEVEKKLTLLTKDPEIESHFSLTDDAFTLFSAPAAKLENQPEYVLQLGKTPFEPSATTPCKRIALDPGHFGGELARLEERYIDLTIDGKRCQFDEGTLNYLTAILLKKKLEDQGFEVMVTKAGIGLGAYHKSFFEWLEEQTPTNPPLPLPQLFRQQYNPLDLYARAEKINAFKPDLTVFIHYNAYDAEGPISEKNFNMVFIPGAFCKGELGLKENRIEFLRLLVTNEIEDSLRLGEAIINEWVPLTQVPKVSGNEKCSYLHNCSIKAADGVYARNLCLTRLVQGPLAYGESLIQNHREECLKLSTHDMEVDGVMTTSRLSDIAQGYFLGIMKYYNSK